MDAGVLWGQKEASESLELEFWAVVSQLESESVLGSDSCPLQEQWVLLNTEPFLQPVAWGACLFVTGFLKHSQLPIVM